MAAKPVSLIRREIEVVMRHSSHLCTESCRMDNAANDAGHIRRVCLCSMLMTSSHSRFPDTAFTVFTETLTVRFFPTY